MPSYSSVIRTLRIAIPTLGALLLIIFFLWPSITNIRLPHIDKAVIKGDRTELINPRYEGKNGDGQRYILTAERAIQTRSDADHVTLIAPTAAMERTDNTTGSKVMAKSGIYNSKTQYLNLADSVTLTTPQGDVFMTTAADADLKSKIMHGDQPISGDGPRMTVNANGFTYDETNGLLTLAGPAKLVLHDANPSAASPAP